MKHISWTKFGGSLIAILGFVFFGNTAFAEYNAFENLNPETNQVFNDNMQGSNGSVTWHFFVQNEIASSMIKWIDMPLCKITSNNGGSLAIEIRTTSTTSPVVASSTILVNDSTVYTGSDCNATTTKTGTTTFTLNKYIAGTIGTQFWITFRTIGITDNVYFKVHNEYPSSNFLIYYGNGNLYYVTPPPDNSLQIEIVGVANGLIPPNQGQGYATTTATSTAENIECDTFYDIYCYGVKAISWTLRPSNDDWLLISGALDELKSDLLYMWPLGYYTDFFYYFETETGTSSLVVIDTQIPQGLPCAGCTIYLDATNGLDMLLNATTGQFALVGEPTENQTFYEITSPYWNKIMVVLVILYIVGRILGFSVTLNNSVTRGGQTYYKGRTTIK